MVKLRRVAFVLLVGASGAGLGLLACTPHTATPSVAHDGAPEAATSIAVVPDGGETPTVTKTSSVIDAPTYIKAHLPKNGTYGEGAPPKLAHTVQAGETAAMIAAAYLDVTEFYTAAELAAAIVKKN